MVFQYEYICSLFARSFSLSLPSLGFSFSLMGMGFSSSAFNVFPGLGFSFSLMGTAIQVFHPLPLMFLSLLLNLCFSRLYGILFWINEFSFFFPS